MLQLCYIDIIRNTYELILMYLAGMIINLSLHTKYLPGNNYYFWVFLFCSLLWFIFSLPLYQYHAKNVTLGLLFDCSTYTNCGNKFVILCYSRLCYMHAFACHHNAAFVCCCVICSQPINGDQRTKLSFFVMWSLSWERQSCSLSSPTAVDRWPISSERRSLAPIFCRADFNCESSHAGQPLSTRPPGKASNQLRLMHAGADICRAERGVLPRLWNLYKSSRFTYTVITIADEETTTRRGRRKKKKGKPRLFAEKSFEPNWQIDLILSEIVSQAGRWLPRKARESVKKSSSGKRLINGPACLAFDKTHRQCRQSEKCRRQIDGLQSTQQPLRYPLVVRRPLLNIAVYSLPSPWHPASQCTMLSTSLLHRALLPCLETFTYVSFSNCVA